MSDLKLPDLNNVLLAGRLTRDPELGSVNGSPFCDFDVAVTRRYHRGDEAKEETSFFTAQCWGRLAEWLSKNAQKGRPVLVSGRLQQNTWEDRETGQKRSKVRIVAESVQMLDWSNPTDQPAAPPPVTSTAKPTWTPAKPSALPITPEDDLPF